MNFSLYPAKGMTLYLCTGKSMADILIVSNVADDVTVDALHEIFPDARDITLPLMRIRFKGKEVGSLKG